MHRYYELIKPGIVYGNALTAIAAFVFAARHVKGFGVFDFPLLIATLLGLSLCIAAACVVNNVMERAVDSRMERTKDRVMVTGQVSARSALIFAGIMFVLGVATLYFFTNIYALFLTLFGVFVYLALYTPAKRTTRHSTIIGAFAGAVPPAVGYVAVAHSMDTNAILLVLILLCWQMAHFFAIAIYRKTDYAEAGLPIMSVSTGVGRTKALMTIYTFLFAYAVLAFAYIDRLSLIYSIPMTFICAGWILLSLSGYRPHVQERRFARTMFFYSLITLLVWCAALALA